MAEKLVIIGLGSAGFACAFTLKKLRANFDITIIDKKGFDLLHSCSMPACLEGKIGLECLKENISLEKMGISVVREKAISIDTKKKEVKTTKQTVPFDRLLISVGAKPIVPPINGVKELLGKNVFLFHDDRDCHSFCESLGKAKKITVIGGGAIGVEVSYALRKKNYEVTLIDMADRLLANSLDKDISDNLVSLLESKGIKVLLSTKAEEITEKEVVTDKGKILYDKLMMSAGVSPNTLLIKETGIEKTPNGILTNEFMETTIKGIYAAGDLAAVTNMVTKKECSANLASSAYQQGLVVAYRLASLNIPYKGALGTFVLSLENYEFASTGLTETAATKAGFSVKSAKLRGKNLYGWHPKAQELAIKLVTDEKGKLLGAQAFGKDAFARIDVVSSAIYSGLSVSDLLGVELSYHPEIRQAHDLLHATAAMLVNRLGRQEK